MLRRTPRSAAFTLLELLLVVAIVAVLASVLLPSAQPAVHEQLRSTARIVAADLAYARSLAVSNGDNYKVAFDLNENRYVLTHSGANPSLSQLPRSPFSSPGDRTDQQLIDLDALPRLGPGVRLAAVAADGTTAVPVGDVEFGPLGQTLRADPTTVWLTAGAGTDKLYITLQVNPITGMTRVGECTTKGPTF